MSIGVSLFLIAMGAILAWGVQVDTEGLNLNTIGLILIVGAIGLLLSMLFWSSFAPFRRRSVVQDDVVTTPTTTTDVEHHHH